MLDDRKIWVIEDKDNLVATNLGDPIGETTRPVAPRPAAIRPRREVPPSPAAAHAPARPAPARPRAAKRSVHSAITLVLAYALGPLGVRLTNRGCRSGFWNTAGIVATLLLAAVGVAWWYAATRGAIASLLPLLTVGTVVGIVAAFTVWAHSLRLLLTSHRFPGRPWPGWVRNPWAAGLLSLPAPGVAWVFTRWPDRAFWTVWAGWPLAVAAALLVQAPMVWRHREVFAGYGLSADVLERILLAAGLVVAAAPLAWLAQALLGARATVSTSDRWRAQRGDWAALALIVTLVGVGVVARPGDLARDLGDGAAVLRADGYRVLPLHLNQVARRLDPGRPYYALEVAELHADRGDHEKADDIRRALDEDMRPYLGALLREGTVRRQASGGGDLAASTRKRSTRADRPARGAGKPDEAALMVARFFIPGLPLELFGPPAPAERTPTAEPTVATPALATPAGTAPEPLGDQSPETVRGTTPH
jgi:hypothetical protein